MWPIMRIMWRNFRSVLLVLVLVSLVEATLTHDQQHRRYIERSGSRPHHRAARLASTTSPLPSPSNPVVDEVMTEEAEVEVQEEEEEGYTYNDNLEDPMDPGEEVEEDLLAAGDDRNCTACAFREEVKRLRLESIKIQILSKLRMERPPNITNPTVPAIHTFTNLVENYEMQGTAPRGHQYREGMDYDDFHASSLEVFIFPSNPPSSLRLNYTNSLFFNFTPEAGKTVRHATLYVHVRPRVSMEEYTTMYVRFYRLAPPSEAGGVPPKMYGSDEGGMPWFLSRKYTVPASGEWYGMDVKQWIRAWSRDPSNNYGIVAEVVDVHEDPQVVSIHGYDNTYRPFVQTRLSDARHRRQRREYPSMECTARSEEPRCCKYELVVDFHAFGWNWVLAPIRYNANFCSGDCPPTFNQRYQHTHLIQQANPSGSAGPCCSPTLMSPITMLYYNEKEEIVFGKLAGMTVEQCGCT